MNRSALLQRDYRIIKFLTSTVTVDGTDTPLLDPKGNRVYRTNREAADKFKLSEFQISRIKNKYLGTYQRLKSDQEE